eukprot:TRINITY_DN1224_c0_g1_i2.p2 TRINITY_DN1224_c0_g1~~TRINITY_DN1224_c0_g1_i2.p2  ORF type:complete len:226 (-),score=-24.41 TRINITY_DN1224_c0_g1_i2:378-1055(-)
MVVDKSNRLVGTDANQARRSIRGIAKPPELATRQRMLKNPLRGKVERRANPAGALNPVDKLLPVLILVIFRTSIIPIPQTIPDLSDTKLRTSALHIHPDKVGRIPLSKIKAPTIKTDMGLKPLEPSRQLGLDGGVRMVDVGGWAEVVASIGTPAPVGEEMVVGGYCPRPPVEALVGRSALEDAPDATLVRFFSATMVDHDIGHAANAASVQFVDEGEEVPLVAIL